ncbi:hypothetical protein LguiA_030148 [Lonicera macranthoides]
MEVSKPFQPFQNPIWLPGAEFSLIRDMGRDLQEIRKPDTINRVISGGTVHLESGRISVSLKMDLLQLLLKLTLELLPRFPNVNRVLNISIEAILELLGPIIQIAGASNPYYLPQYFLGVARARDRKPLVTV